MPGKCLRESDEAVSYTHLDIPELVRKKGIDAIYVALPSAPVDDIKDILGICQKTGCQVKYCLLYTSRCV